MDRNSGRKATVLILLMATYLLLSAFKLFTGVVVGPGDPTVRLVAKGFPTISNYWHMAGEESTARAVYRGTWYFKGNYLVITADEHGFTGETAYWFFIKVWWLVTWGIALYSLGLVCFLVFKRPGERTER